MTRIRQVGVWLVGAALSALLVGCGARPRTFYPRTPSGKTYRYAVGGQKKSMRSYSYNETSVGGGWAIATTTRRRASRTTASRRGTGVWDDKASVGVNADLRRLRFNTHRRVGGLKPQGSR